MDKSKVEQIAREHKQLAQPRASLDPFETEAAREQEGKALNQLWQQIAHESSEYCEAYNEAFGSARLR